MDRAYQIARIVAAILPTITGILGIILVPDIWPSLVASDRRYYRTNLGITVLLDGIAWGVYSILRHLAHSKSTP